MTQSDNQTSLFTGLENWIGNGINFITVGAFSDGGTSGYLDSSYAAFRTKFFNDPDSSGGNAGVKGVAAPDGGVPQSKGFFASLGDMAENLGKAANNLSTPATTAESVASTSKWIAIGIAAIAVVFIVAKEG